ncbi:hypothetical protein FOA52_002488 [Chlamydomonas sp. UWO 241]|nr:hypothetical protein FOA52_002488 [Chlamydomonas sp. UWO 241]
MSPTSAAASKAPVEILSNDKAIAQLKDILKTNPGNRAAKFFNQEYYDSLTPELQDRLMRCLRSGTYNADSGVGCYAMQPEDYDDLRGFFAPLIADYHGVPEGSGQPTDWETAPKMDLAALGLGPSSSRVRVGRNLAAFPLPGAITKEQRMEMEQVMSVAYAALAKLDMPNGKAFGGRYYSLTPGRPDSISDEEYKGLIKEHLMFKDMAADTYLNTAGISGDWPYGRGTYISDDRRVSIWCNEEDHLRVTVLMNTTTLNEPFDLLGATLKALETVEGVVFKKSSEFGYVTSCPSNLGTGMRASVMVCLPLLTADASTDKASAIAKPFGLSVRGSGGEHTPVVNNMVDISPSARFGISESEILKRLFGGVEAMMKEEQKIAAAALTGHAAVSAVEILSNDKAIALLKDILKTNPGNRAAKFFNQEYYDSLTPELQDRLMRCLRSGTYNADSGVGCYAMQPEDYDDLRGFFAPLIADYHGVPEGSGQPTDWETAPKMDLAALGLGPSSSRVRVGRNLAAFPLPGAMTKEQRMEMEQVMSVAYAALAKLDMPNGKAFGGRYYSLTPGRPDSIDDKEYAALIKEHLMFKDMAADTYLNTAGISGDWPHGRGTYISDDRRVSIWCNEEDHLRVTVLCPATTSLNEPFDLLGATLKALETVEGVVFKKSSEFGYVTSCPSNLGTGMRASVMVCLPLLTADASTDKASAIAKPFGLSVRGSGGEHTPVVNNMVDISPSARFGISESEILKRLFGGVEAMMKEEQKIAAAALTGHAAVSAVEILSNDKAIALLKDILKTNPGNRAAKFFNQEYYDSLTPELQDRLMRCLRSGTYNADSGVGCYAMQPEDYDDLRGFFAPLIADYHGVPEGSGQPTDWETAPKMDLAALGLGPSSSRVRVGRNLAAFPLPGAMTKEQRMEMEQVMSVAYAALAKLDMPNSKAFGGRYYSLTPGRPDSIDDKEYAALIKEHLMFKDMAADTYLNTAGISGDWPHGRGTYISDDRRVSIWCNEEDHLRVTVLCPATTSLNEPFDLLGATLKALETVEGVVFKKSSEFGYVTSCPSNLGTGMRASVMVCLPLLTADASTDKASAIAKPFGLSVRGSGGEHTPVVNNMVDISPSARFGISESEILKRLFGGVEAMMKEEKKIGATK